MSCTRPLTAYWRSVARDAITFDKAKSATKIPFNLPCGRCIGCRLEKARQWGMRCMHEAKMWPVSSYVTLTYNDEYMPLGRSLSVRDLQLFMKRLRKARKATASNPIRFFVGGEYGEHNDRPHYHMLLFNCGFPDRRIISNNKRGEPLYTSKELERLWSVDGNCMGFCTIGEVTFDSAVYCAKYALKKVTGDLAYAHYEMIDELGEVRTRVPEFALMSRRPGVGATYYDKFGADVRAHDNLIVNNRPVRPPKFYDTRSERIDPVGFLAHKKARKRLAVANKADNTPERLQVKETLMVRAAEKKERNL